MIIKNRTANRRKGGKGSKRERTEVSWRVGELLVQLHVVMLIWGICMWEKEIIKRQEARSKKPRGGYVCLHVCTMSSLAPVLRVQRRAMDIEARCSRVEGRALSVRRVECRGSRACGQHSSMWRALERGTRCEYPRTLQVRECGGTDRVATMEWPQYERSALTRGPPRAARPCPPSSLRSEVLGSARRAHSAPSFINAFKLLATPKE